MIEGAQLAYLLGRADGEPDFMPADMPPPSDLHESHLRRAMSQTPSVGRIVHYVSYGTPGGEYPSVCRAAIVTELAGAPDHPDRVGLAVLNPTGVFFDRTVGYHDGAETPGAPDCPNSGSHGNPHRYCACGWIEASHCGGTWHWPERA